MPSALDVVLENLDVFTLTWYRFAAAGLVLGLILHATNHVPELKSVTGSVWVLLCLAFAGLTGNYVLYAKALQHSSPTIVQTVGQLGPMFLLFGGLIVFREYFSRFQSLGFAMSGLALFSIRMKREKWPRLWVGETGLQAKGVRGRPPIVWLWRPNFVGETRPRDSIYRVFNT